MNKYENNIFATDIELPDIVRQKAQAAFLQIKKGGGKYGQRKKHRNFSTLLITAAACTILVCTAAFLGGLMKGKGEGFTAELAERETSEIKNNPLDFFSDFTLKAYAAESEASASVSLPEANSGRILLRDIGMSGCGFTGVLFGIQGEGIAQVEISIDKGELSSVMIKECTQREIWKMEMSGEWDEIKNSGTEIFVGDFDSSDNEDTSGEQINTLFYNTKEGERISDEYTPEKYYGLCISEEDYAEAEKTFDLREMHLKELGVFEGATLSVTTIFTDESRLTKEYSLSVEKLLFNEEGELTQEEWLGEGEGNYAYGILATEKN